MTHQDSSSQTWGISKLMPSVGGRGQGPGTNAIFEVGEHHTTSPVRLSYLRSCTSEEMEAGTRKYG